MLSMYYFNAAIFSVFYQLDIPEVMQIREQLLPAHENESLVFASMFETQWMDDIKQAHPEGQFLFIISHLSSLRTSDLIIEIA